MTKRAGRLRRRGLDRLRALARPETHGWKPAAASRRARGRDARGSTTEPQAGRADGRRRGAAGADQPARRGARPAVPLQQHNGLRWRIGARDRSGETVHHAGARPTFRNGVTLLWPAGSSCTWVCPRPARRSCKRQCGPTGESSASRAFCTPGESASTTSTRFSTSGARTSNTTACTPAPGTGSPTSCGPGTASGWCPTSSSAWPRAARDTWSCRASSLPRSMSS